MEQEYSFSFLDAGMIGQQKINKEKWRFIQVEVAVGGYIVSGSSREGCEEEDFDKVVITEPEMAEHAKTFEADQDRCWDCKGETVVQSGWSRDKGTSYKECPRCNGTGKPKA